MTPEQQLTAIANVIMIGIVAMLGWTMFCDWIDKRYIKPWIERIRKSGDIDV